jgi:DNA-directed RNA polymerase subunit K/omega
MKRRSSTLANEKKVNLPDGDGAYMIVNLVARRARDINKVRVNTLFDEEAPDPMDVALNEYNNSLLDFEFRHHLVGTGEDYRSN